MTGKGIFMNNYQAAYRRKQLRNARAASAVSFGRNIKKTSDAEIWPHAVALVIGVSIGSLLGLWYIAQ
jgi:hypothetical protein